MILMNTLIAGIGLISIILAVRFFSDATDKDYLKYHWFLLLIKLILVSGLIFVFTYDQTGKKMWILSGGIIFVVFHLIEGFLVQQTVNKKD
ncbi:MAG: hypothetical protein ISS00_02885 [Candidatus Marinimicrobia bacterium]|nr:hypothetical protein [Candidatus Neomarinimicrobiota bacterium]